MRTGFWPGVGIALAAAATAIPFPAQAQTPSLVATRASEQGGDLAFGRFIELIRGHLLTGDELVIRRAWNLAYPHFTFPTEEIYGVIRDELHD